MTTRKTFNILFSLLLITGALANEFTGEYRLVYVTQGEDKALSYPTSKKVKIIKEDSKYFMVTEEPMITVTRTDELVEASSILKNAIVFSKSKRRFQISFTAVGEDSIFTKIFRGVLDEKTSNFECRGDFLSSYGSKGKFIISK